MNEGPKGGRSEPFDNLRGLIGGWDQYYLVPMVRGTGFENDMANYFKDVKPDANVTLLARGSIGAYGGEQMLDVADISQESVEAAGGSFEFGSWDMVKTRFASGTGDVFIQVATRGHPGITELATQNQLTFLQPSGDVLAKMTELYGWGEATLPAGTFSGQDKDVKLPGTTTTLFSSTNMSDDLAYTIVKTICENTEALQNAHKALSDFDCEKNGVWREDVNGIPMHEGALRYFRERGWVQ
ncbi:TAXI family TRAP transporter solute-binding subunit [Sedimentitalea sp. XS_ASV28]|uniref:TAXI family TRAP transporter solute-binding subunit n=1 Tax=Sedimentitalea sp. XS_ASV28 TaxID=3241296 RepID=UPI003514FE70